ncbi:MAG: hypothetical protein IPG72_13915 [Ardenticatenales bacterium]|jgi:Ni/Fe-hydrogenase subunit HybB-like protein|nr:hypothetical protein [Ardenticatenales bacterium]
MTDNDARTSANRLGLWGAGITLPGIVFSSPIAVVLISRLYPQPTWQDARHRPRTFVAVAFTTVFAMLICINHIVQATFVPALVRDGQAIYASTSSAS